jgi:RsiW-degrading membrane proteinase PrsW (M82 family)
MILVALAIAPGLFWLWYFRRRDHLRPEPRALVARVFFLGVGAAVAAALLELAVFGVTGIDSERPDWGVIPTALLIGLIEEGTKFAAVYAGVYRHHEFDEVVDGIIYAVAASLGFATIENVAYVLQGGFAVGVLRAVLSVPGHAFFGALMGFYMGIAKHTSTGQARWLAYGLALAIGAHALFNAMLLTQSALALAVLPLTALLWRRALLHTHAALALDDQRAAVATPRPPR